jgi:hypothetical protein
LLIHYIDEQEAIRATIALLSHDDSDSDNETEDDDEKTITDSNSRTRHPSVLIRMILIFEEISIPQAEAIVAKYSTISVLLNAFDNYKEEPKRVMLSKIKYDINKTIGDEISSKIYWSFCCASNDDDYESYKARGYKCKNNK